MAYQGITDPEGSKPQGNPVILDPETYSPAWEEMELHWQSIDMLNGGTIAFQSEAAVWLPKEEGETDTKWKARVSRSILYGAYKETKRELLSLPYSEEVRLDNADDLPEELDDIGRNADMCGTSLTDFCRQEMEEAIDRGLVFTLVDMPPARGDERLPEVRSRNLRPFFTTITAKQLIDYTEEEGPNYVQRLTSIKWETQANENDGSGQKRVRCIRRMTFVYQDEMSGPDSRAFESGAPGFSASRPSGIVESWEYRKKDGKSTKMEWKYMGSREHSYVGCPLEPLWINRKSHMVGMPVLEDLAFLNIAHAQSDSDQRSCLRFGRIGILLLTGISPRLTGEAPLIVGPGSVIQERNAAATGQYLEQGGSALNAGRQDIFDLEARMEVMGLKPLYEKRTSSGSATGAVMDAAQQTSDLSSWVRLQQTQKRKCFAHAVRWVDKTAVGKEDDDVLPKDFEIDIAGDFSIPYNDAQGIAALRNMRVDGDLDHETYIDAIKRRKLLPESVTSKEIQKKLKKEQDDDAEGFAGGLDAMRAARFMAGKQGQPGQPGQNGFGANGEQDGAGANGKAGGAKSDLKGNALNEVGKSARKAAQSA